MSLALAIVLELTIRKRNIWKPDHLKSNLQKCFQISNGRISDSHFIHLSGIKIPTEVQCFLQHQQYFYMSANINFSRWDEGNNKAACPHRMETEMTLPTSWIFELCFGYGRL